MSIEEASPSTPGVPPSSSQSFIRYRPQIPAVVLAEHEAQYTNQYYHSHFDDHSNINVEDICRSSMLLARTIFILAANDSDALPFPLTLTCPNVTLAAEIIFCLTVDFSCNLVAEYLWNVPIDPQPTQYSSVYSPYGLLSLTAKFVHDFMYHMTAQSIRGSCSSDSDCESTELCIKQQCMRSSTYFHDALSLGIELDSNGLWKVTNSSMPLWTESDWDIPHVSIFMMESPVVETVTLVVGITELLGSFGAVYFLRQFFTKRFKMM